MLYFNMPYKYTYVNQYNSLLMPTKLHAIISGRLQGVGFRYYAHAQARYRGLNGYVRNLGNGTVEVMVEGERNTL